MIRTVLRSQRVATPEGVCAASLHIGDEQIVRVASWNDVDRDAALEDVGDLLVMPGVVDSHVHVNEPGRTEWEGFESATRAAAAGGVTTILDMPLNAIPATTTAAALEAKRTAAQGKCVVNVEYIGGVVPGNAGELEGLRDAGVRAFKCFLAPSGVDEFPAVDESDLRMAMPVLARLGLPLMVHAEDPAWLVPGDSGGSRVYADYLASRPVVSEQSAIALLVRLLEEHRSPVHVVHLSSPASLSIVNAARARGLPITVETCPHYLTFASSEIPDGATEYKCAPPIRTERDREGLWTALIAGEIDLVASDHSPCPAPMKETGGDFFSAWGGIASLQISLPAVWTGARARGIEPTRMAQWMSAGPATISGLDRTKGRLAAGYDADIVVWDPDESFVVDPVKLWHRHPITPYAGRKLFGKVTATYVRGHRVFGGESPSRVP